MIYALLGCSKRKAGRRCAARELYSRSPRFRHLLAVAEQRGEHVLILSAHHGLVHPDAELDPYDVTLLGRSYWERRLWGRIVAVDLLDLLRPGDQVVSYLSSVYAEFVLPELRARGIMVHEPIKGLRPGEVLQWCKQNAN